jgi:hypothetical protein
MDSFRIDAFTTKIGLSSGAVIGLSSLRDELPEFRRTGVGMIGSVWIVVDVAGFE